MLNKLIVKGKGGLPCETQDIVLKQTNKVPKLPTNY